MIRQTPYQFAIALILVSLSGVSLAQGMGGGGMGRGGRHGRGSDSNAAAANPATLGPQERSVRLNDQLNDLQLRLMLTPAQSDLYQAFYNKAFALLDLLVRSDAATDGQSAVEVLDEHAARLQKQAAAWQEVADATRKLYVALTPEQRGIADQYLPHTLP